MNVIKNLISKKTHNSLVSAQEHETVTQVLKKLSDHDLEALLIMKEGQISGIFTEKDFVAELLIRGKRLLNKMVKDVMRTQVHYVTPDYTLEECLALMTKKKIRHLPVIDQGKLLAVITIEDVIEALLEDQVYHIVELTKYVTGTSLYPAPSPLPENVKELIWRQEFQHH